MSRQNIISAVVVILVLVGVWASSVEHPASLNPAANGSATLPLAAVIVSTELPTSTATSGPILLTATPESAATANAVLIPSSLATDAPRPTVQPTAFVPVVPLTVAPTAIIPPTPISNLQPHRGATQSPIPNPQPLTPDPSLSAAEQGVIDQVNYQRSLAGLPLVARNETLMQIAEARAADMVARGYFGHDDPATGQSAARTQAMQAGFKRAGENIFESIAPLTDFPAHAVEWFMGDAPHRDNILHPVYTSIGAGIAANGQMWILSLVFGA